jgi:transposase
MAFVAGLDWGGALHAVCVVDGGSGAVAERFEARHDAEGLRALVRRLARLGDAALLPVAIERPSGLIVDVLVEAGHPVVPIHPNVVKAARPRYRASGAKDDRGDAYLLADLLRTDGHRFRPLALPSDAIRALRALTRSRDDLVATRVALANQLTSQLEDFWAGAEAIFADVASPIALAFLARYPTPQSAARLGEKRLAAFLAAHAYCGRRTPAELLARLRTAPAGLAGEAEAEARGEVVRALVAVLAPLVAQIAELSARIRHALAELPDGPLIMSFPRAGQICELAADAGLAPVTRQSGRSRGVGFRWACNPRLRTALTCFADNSRHASAWAADIYARARARGCRHPHAIRILGRAWTRVLWRAWQDQVLYDPAKHTAAAARG